MDKYYPPRHTFKILQIATITIFMAQKNVSKNSLVWFPAVEKKLQPNYCTSLKNLLYSSARTTWASCRVFLLWHTHKWSAASGKIDRQLHWINTRSSLKELLIIGSLTMCLCYSWYYRLQSTFFLHFHPQALVGRMRNSSTI